MTEFKPEDIVDTQALLLTVNKLKTGQVVVILGGKTPEPPRFEVLMAACEYLLFITAQNSNAGFEKALELLCEGATKYKHLFVPENKPKEEPNGGDVGPVG